MYSNYLQIIKDSASICHYRYGSALLFKLDLSLRQYILEIIEHAYA